MSGGIFILSVNNMFASSASLLRECLTEDHLQTIIRNIAPGIIIPHSIATVTKF